MVKTYQTSDGWSVTVETRDGLVHWTEQGGDEVPHTYFFGHVEAQEIGDAFRSHEHYFRGFLPFGIPIGTDGEKYLRLAEDARRLVTLVEQATYEIARS